ncbi:unnamed protein product, partial [Mesorhabditis belari]|uniref:Uncharacterized protein n=1 Tax=Mesorhabditis belari TaxID=2138241 RepID=A0AAF3ERQ9_9BILA
MLHFLHILLLIFGIAFCGKKKSQKKTQSAPKSVSVQLKSIKSLQQPDPQANQPPQPAAEPAGQKPKQKSEVVEKTGNSAPTETETDAEKQKRILADIELKFKKEEAAGVPQLQFSSRRIEKERQDKQQKLAQSRKSEKAQDV